MVGTEYVFDSRHISIQHGIFISLTCGGFHTSSSSAAGCHIGFIVNFYPVLSQLSGVLCHNIFARIKLSDVSTTKSSCQNSGEDRTPAPSPPPWFASLSLGPVSFAYSSHFVNRSCSESDLRKSDITL